LQGIIDFINENKDEEVEGEEQIKPVAEDEPVADYSNVEFDDI
jgi:hypothetical protein